MIRNTFCHIPGIGLKRERRFWGLGLHEWSDLSVSSLKDFGIRVGKAEEIVAYIDRSKDHLEKRDPRFFAERIPLSQHWRLFPEFREHTAYLDIETTGMGSPIDAITTIALYDGRSIMSFVNGENLHQFRNHITRYQILVTYNGKCFDIPFIRNYLGVPMDHVQIDLRYVLSRLGYTGGLKRCEKQLSIDRGELNDLDGLFAVLLWHDYRKNKNPKALETLMAYNIQDAVNLEKLMVLAYNLMVEETPFSETNRLPDPAQPEIPWKPHLETIEKLKADFWR